MRALVLLVVASCSGGERATVAPDAGACAAAEVACGDRTCPPGTYCTLLCPGECPLPPDGGYLTSPALPDCHCVTAACQPLPAGCHGCDCLPADTCRGNPTCSCRCGPGGGVIESGYFP
jgi:hypothetical protein